MKKTILIIVGILVLIFIFDEGRFLFFGNSSLTERNVVYKVDYSDYSPGSIADRDNDCKARGGISEICGVPTYSVLGCDFVQDSCYANTIFHSLAELGARYF